MKCRDVSHLIATDALRDLPLWQRLRLRFHLLMCEQCRRYAAQLREMGRGVREKLAAAPEPERQRKMEEAILRRLRASGDESEEDGEGD